MALCHTSLTNSYFVADNHLHPPSYILSSFLCILLLGLPEFHSFYLAPHTDTQAISCLSQLPTPILHSELALDFGFLH